MALAGFLLLVEYLAISYTFDAQTVVRRGGIWTILGEAGRIGPLLIVGATALLLFPSKGQKKSDPPRPVPAPIRWLLLLHLLFFATFVSFTNWGFGGERAPRGPALAWLLLWAGLGFGTAASLFVGLVGDWKRLAGSLGRGLAAGGVLGLAAWVAGSASTALWQHLSRATFVTVATLLDWMSLELFVDEQRSLLELEGFAIEVAPVCSGFEGIGLFFVLASGFIYTSRATLRFPHGLLLLPIGMSAVWFGNAIRIAALMLVGARYDPGVAIGSFHSKAGWVFFCAITLLIVTLAKRSRFFVSSTMEASVAGKNPAAPLLIPVLVWMGVGLATSTFSDGHDPLYGVRVLATGLVLWIYRNSYVEYLKAPRWLSWLIGALVGVLWLVVPALVSDRISANASGAGVILPGGGNGPIYLAWLGVRCVGAVLIVPMIEELAFRSFLPRWICNRDFWTVPFEKLSLAGIALSSVVFGALHGQWLLGIGTGVIYALLVRRSGQLSDAIVAHMTSNLVIALWVLSTKSFHYW